MKNIRYYAYLEISRYAQLSQLYSIYKELEIEFKSFATQRVTEENQIWPVFKKLFSKEKKDA